MCFLEDFKKIPDSCLSLFFLGCCTHTRQVEHQRCSRTSRVQKNHNILMNTLYFHHHQHNALHASSNSPPIATTSTTPPTATPTPSTSTFTTTSPPPTCRATALGRWVQSDFSSLSPYRTCITSINENLSNVRNKKTSCMHVHNL